MINNLPTEEALNTSALKLYFSVWQSLLTVIYDFDRAFPDSIQSIIRLENNFEWRNDWVDYLKDCQSEFQTLYIILQQSNELALKAKICAISPYLLLLGTKPKFGSQKEIDFTNLRTLDAVDLPDTVNLFTPEPLSDAYREFYTHIRALRNKFTHLGETSSDFHPIIMIRQLLFQYSALWKNKIWMQDRLQFASNPRQTFFYCLSNYSDYAEVMDELPFIFKVFKNSDCKNLLGIKKSTRLYRCHSCVHEATDYDFDVAPENTLTAYIDTVENKIVCLLCGERTSILRKSCLSKNCEGNVIGANDDEFDSLCHSCGF